MCRAAIHVLNYIGPSVYLSNSPTRLRRRTPGIEVIMFGGGFRQECDSDKNISSFYTYVPMKPLKFADQTN